MRRLTKGTVFLLLVCLTSIRLDFVHCQGHNRVMKELIVHDCVLLTPDPEIQACSGAGSLVAVKPWFP